ncbi:MAG: NADH-ubiquinone oxidoreductase-F iron-sulfur binding region domain-containing protein [Gammaproteobacteria bacterium]
MSTTDNSRGKNPQPNGSTESPNRRKGRARGRPLDTGVKHELEQLLAEHIPLQRDRLIEYLHVIQDTYRAINSARIVALADLMGLASTEVFEVATFYHHFDVIEADADSPPALTVRVCESVTCAMYGSEALQSELNDRFGDQVRIQPVPCVGRCASAPVAVVGMNPIESADAEKISHAIAANDTQAETVNYLDLSEYKKVGGYELLKACRAGEHTPEKIIELLKDSNLRGLGGAGFPAGTKWSILAQQAKPRLIAVNIDEGEPGTFKDRYYLERDPHRFVEGMLIAAWAIEAEACYIYLRDEYAACREILEKELAAIKHDSSLELPHIELRRGAGAYICGEESAMIESIEGKRGMPRLRPPYVAEVGLFGRPTLEHNMETLHWIRDIVQKGPEWFTSHGRHERSGLRSFSVSGRVKNPGVHLAPAGITITELIDEYCGGMCEGHKFYGYFPGGASGGILPASMGDIPLDFDTLQPYGCFIGSAAIMVFSEQDSARDLALNAMRFFEHESCGQCTPCRVGTAKASILMSENTWDLNLLEELAVAMVDASICGLGQAAPNPMRCAIKYFPQEFET